AYDDAVKSLRQSVAANAQWGDPIFNWPALALALQRQSQEDEARKALDRVDRWLDHQLENRAPEAVDPPPLRGSAPTRWCDWAKFQILYREASAAIRGSATSDHPRMWVLRGRAHALLGLGDEAAGDYARATALRPDDPHLWIERGRFHAGRQEGDLALASFTKAVEVRPNDSAGWLARGRYHAERGPD